MAEEAEDHDDGDDLPSRARPFRFKESVDPKNTYKSSSSSSHTRSRHHHRRHHSHRKHHRRRHSSEARSKSRSRSREPRHDRSRSPIRGTRRQQYERSRSPGPPSRDLSPDTAFRESLFDAMADDEGAAYWEGVYGQPIHNFGPMPSRDGESYEGDAYHDPGVLDADAYAAFVRRKMWERSHQHILEERARREAERKRLEEMMRKEAEERRRRNEEKGQYWYNDRTWRTGNYDGYAFAFDQEDLAVQVEESLKRGQARREDKRWREAWDRYNERWVALLEAQQKGESGELPWPVLSSKQRDVDPGAVRDFFNRAPAAAAAQKDGKGEDVDLKGIFKAERVRWHPDKIMQRFSSSLDEEVLKKVTAVFQVVDQLYSEQKGKA